MLRTVTFNSCKVLLTFEGAELHWHDGAVNSYDFADYDSAVSARRVGMVDTFEWLRASALAAAFLEDLLGKDVPDGLDQELIAAANMVRLSGSLTKAFAGELPEVVRHFKHVMERSHPSDESKLTAELKGRLNGKDNTNGGTGA